MTMEKKEYIEPSMIVRNVFIETLMQSMSFDDENNTGTGTVIDEDASGDALGKRNGFTSDDLWED